MTQPEDKSYIEELKKSLYSRGAPDVRTRRKLRFIDRTPEVQTSWEEPKEVVVDPTLNQHYEDNSMSYFTKILIGSAIFCVIALGTGAYLFFNGSNLISADNITITVNAPVSVPGGTPVAFDIVVTNKNNVDLQTADLAVEFPAGTTDPVDSTKELKKFQELLGDISAGSAAEKTVKAIMFGEENTQRSIVVTVAYKVKGSNSLFTKNTTYDVLISSSPISVTVDTFKEVASGQEFDMKVGLKSNSQDTLKSIVMKAQYPPGYAFISADIKPLTDNATWKIGDIPPGGARNIIIHGKLTGEDSELRVFRFAVGAQSSTDQKNIGTQYMAVEHDVTVQKPFISLAVSINGDETSTDYIGQSGSSNNIEIDWVNNLPVFVSNMVITAKLSGTAYDKLNVQPRLGSFQSISDQIVWNQQTNPDLASVAAGATGVVSFSLIPKSTSTVNSSVTNPQILTSVTVSGNRTQETGVSSSLSAAATRTIRVASNVSLSGRVVRTVGPFTNTGPVPLKAEKVTTFTVIWDVDNTSNPVGNAEVTAILPTNVKWMKNVSPSSENVTYDSNTGKITWQVGNIGTYTLNTNKRREVAFQVSVMPGVDLIGQTIMLIDTATLTGLDSFTGAKLTSTQGNMTSRFSTDPAYKDGDGNVE
ncbi:MAG: hypothetical protein WCG02_00415 [Candidatus Taylorbacteria bacterium]